MLRRFDHFLAHHGLVESALPRELVECWIAKQPHESPITQQRRIGLTRQLATFLVHHGYAAYIPDSHLSPKNRSSFVPYIFTHEEIHRLLRAADHLSPDPRSPLREHTMPELFRLLYSCGLRVSEALHLHVSEVDLDAGVLTIHQGKFRKDRLVPLPPALTQRLRQYARVIGERSADAVFFPAPHGGPYHRDTIYKLFRYLLWVCRIPHGGRGHGPRLHDVRHNPEYLLMPSRFAKQGESLAR